VQNNQADKFPHGNLYYGSSFYMSYEAITKHTIMMSDLKVMYLTTMQRNIKGVMEVKLHALDTCLGEYLDCNTVSSLSS
jgi:hypothetical protein